ncbi:hypothetical protein EV356DRAFT_383497 [Viridothelium virens]|uniref:Uncharacterized protein n=1 Tax=Viridothelium virens TaxID=1048519 RepID=A0A6A6HIP1_VIRVR|nr:hypothetical protein EV356DRAFT_383497 [Viridothelium virens]
MQRLFPKGAHRVSFYGILPPFAWQHFNNNKISSMTGSNTHLSAIVTDRLASQARNMSTLAKRAKRPTSENLHWSPETVKFRGETPSRIFRDIAIAREEIVKANLKLHSPSRNIQNVIDHDLHTIQRLAIVLLNLRSMNAQIHAVREGRTIKFRRWYEDNSVFALYGILYLGLIVLFLCVVIKPRKSL